MCVERSYPAQQKQVHLQNLQLLQIYEMCAPADIACITVHMLVNYSEPAGLCNISSECCHTPKFLYKETHLSPGEAAKVVTVLQERSLRC